MSHDDQIPARLSLPALRRDLAAYGELQDSFAQIAQSVERDAQRLERQLRPLRDAQRRIANSGLAVQLARQQELLDASIRPLRDAQRSIVGSLDSDDWSRRLETLGASGRAALDAQQRIADSLDSDQWTRRLETLGASGRAALDAQQRIADSLDSDQWTRGLETLGASGRAALDAQQRIADSLDSDDWSRRLETLLGGGVRSVLDVQENITDSLETVGATRSSLLDRLKEGKAPFDNLGAAYLQAPAVAPEMPVVDLPRPIVPLTRRARRRKVVLVGVTAADPVEFLVENLIARREIAADPFLYECLTVVRHWLRVGRPLRAVDRAHSAVHRMLQIIAEEAGWEANRRTGVLDLYRYVRKHHPAFAADGGDEKALELVGPLVRILHVISETRNQHSLAHPSPDLISEPLARLVVHMTLAMFEFVAGRDAATQPGA